MWFSVDTALENSTVTPSNISLGQGYQVAHRRSNRTKSSQFSFHHLKTRRYKIGNSIKVNCSNHIAELINIEVS